MALNNAELLESLAADIGAAVYLDVAKWHLYLNDAKLHQPLAEQLYHLLEDNNLSENAVQQVLQSFSIKLGGGRREIPLADLIPLQCQLDLMDLLEKHQRDL
jgi:hypothetical protein